MTKIIRYFLLSFSFVVFTFPYALAQAPVKSYYYQNFDSKITVNPDSTLDISEKEVFVFSGEFHTAFRNIPLAKIGSITDISVIDFLTNQPLVYSSSQLEKTSPSSWGKYTYYREGGNMNIAWYFNSTNETRAWLVKYKVHGALAFNSDSVRVYWNIFSGFTVPINSSEVSFSAPEPALAYTAYRSSSLPISMSKNSNGGLDFSAQNFSPSEAFTIDVTLPKTSVPASAYWQDFLKSYWGIIASAILILLSLILVLIIWLKREKLAEGKGTIVPEYQPPQNLKPAMAEALLTEKVTNRGLTATMVDLAVRGYVKIEEDETIGALKKMFGGLIKIGIVLRFGIIIFIFVFFTIALISSEAGLSFAVPIMLFSAFCIWAVFSASKAKDYKVSLLKTDYYGDTSLEVFEKKYLDLLFTSGNVFSTFQMKSAPNTRKREIYEGMQKVKEEVYKNTQTGTKAFEVDPYEGRKQKYFASVLVAIVIAVVFFGLPSLQAFNSATIFCLVFLLCLMSLIAYIKFEPRLNQEGRVLRDDWLGFKLFLQTAERYRLQNLTPDMFQKFLPYAMVFGIEKKWAKAFEGINVPPPNWYHSSAVYVGASGSFSGSSTGFSPTGFSTSFSTAFSSAFASSGASGGGGGGGGGAGGGGGGGGGGAG